MKTGEFQEYKARFRTAIRRGLIEAAPGRLDEAAFPAYSHPNLVINFLFWQRIRKVIDFLEENAPYDLALDFGCGSGVMLPFLGQACARVIAIDIDLYPLETVKPYITLPENIEFRDARDTFLGDLPSSSFDVIIALDVLEHVEDLNQTLADLCKLLRTGGRLVVSGPTENPAYKIGRLLAGPEYSGEYHERSVRDIKKALSAFMNVKKIATLYYPIPLFEIFYGFV